MDETPLFENLADQSTPERPRGQPRLQVPRRDTIELRVVDLDGLVAADDPVRVNYRTPSDFRGDNEDLLNRRPSRSVAVLVKEGLVHLDRLSLDGLRVRAWACRPRACSVAAGANKQKEPRASTTDPPMAPGARVMKLPDGGFRPAYNGQGIAEPVSGIILGVALDTGGSDHGWVTR